MRILLCGIANTFFLVLLVAGSSSEEHVNAQPLGKLVYNDFSIDVKKESAQQVLQDFEKRLNILMSVAWEGDDDEGIDPTTPITLKLSNQPALIILERITSQLNPEKGATWQLRHGTLEIGLKQQLASRGRQRLETHYIQDLLFTIRNFSAPELDTFTGTGGDNRTEPSQQEEINRVIELIVKFVEPELWEQNNGPCSISNYKKTILIRAPDFVHRQINGYSFSARKPKDERERRVLYSGDKTRIVIDKLPLR